MHAAEIGTEVIANGERARVHATAGDGDIIAEYANGELSDWTSDYTAVNPMNRGPRTVPAKTTTRRHTEADVMSVMPEDEARDHADDDRPADRTVTVNGVDIELFWCDAIGRYVTIPDRDDD